MGERLRAAAAPLLEDFRLDSDLEPAMIEQKLQVVNSSLYPLIFCRSCVLIDKGKTDLESFMACYGQSKAPLAPTIQCADSETLAGNQCSRRAPENDRWSAKFQSLPCKVNFTEEGDGKCHIT
jgi:hypothetical protein